MSSLVHSGTCGQERVNVSGFLTVFIGPGFILLDLTESQDANNTDYCYKKSNLVNKLLLMLDKLHVLMESKCADERAVPLYKNIF